MFSKNLHATSQMRDTAEDKKGDLQKVCCVNSWNGICTLLRKGEKLPEFSPKSRELRETGTSPLILDPGNTWTTQRQSGTIFVLVLELLPVRGP
ncbi:hypothetical protein CDAR_96501 [Caerostris darwini]|uniref:Uncharacterized protein n=1 Tax=Caerostris darwini TaxID=1538125 RepID=A0AAV4QU78_9ARAC|nr:hypothetical protein CDAR_96501 [Caerostris darwini]